ASHCTFLFLHYSPHPRVLHSFPTRRSSDLGVERRAPARGGGRCQSPGARRRGLCAERYRVARVPTRPAQRAARGVRVRPGGGNRSEEHTSELQSRGHLVCRLLLEKKKTREN